MSNLVLWGHDIKDYQEMFAIDLTHFSGNILEFASGPSAFNSSRHELYLPTISIDPLFALDKQTLKSKTTLIFDDMKNNVEANAEKFQFESCGGLPALVEERKQGMARFFADYDVGIKEGRYAEATGFPLPFPDFYFDLALSSHYLFGEMDNQDLAFHLQVIKELARVAKEVRIFPLIDRQGQPSAFIGPILLELQQQNYGVEVKSVNYSLQKEENALLRIWAQQCDL